MGVPIASSMSRVRERVTLTEVFSVLALGASLLAIVSGTCLSVRPRFEEASCLGNLGRIGAAVRMYSDDFDGLYPAAYSSVRWPEWKSSNWSWSLEPYLSAGATNEMGKNNGYRTDGGDKGPVSLGWANSGGAIWHCPSDPTGTNISYGANPFVMGADEYQEDSVRVDSWRPSKRSAEIDRPESILLAGDTTKQWHDDVGRYYEVYGDWMRDRDLPKKDGRPMDAVETLAWYSGFLREDDTDVRAECPRPGGWGCKGPAYWHGRAGLGTGAAGMVFCDGHAKAMPFGSIRTEQLVPGSSPVGGSR